MITILVLILVIIGIGVWIENFKEMFFTFLILFGLMCAIFGINPIQVFFFPDTPSTATTVCGSACQETR